MANLISKSVLSVHTVEQGIAGCVHKEAHQWLLFLNKVIGKEPSAERANVTYIYIYIYIYLEREGEGDRERGRGTDREKERMKEIDREGERERESEKDPRCPAQYFLWIPGGPVYRRSRASAAHAAGVGARRSGCAKVCRDGGAAQEGFLVPPGKS